MKQGDKRLSLSLSLLGGDHRPGKLEGTPMLGVGCVVFGANRWGEQVWLIG